MFNLISKFKLTGDQPEAVAKLSKGIKDGLAHQTLIGVTGSGKTYTIANVIKNYGKPTLVISHNKTLAAQLYQELKDFFPNNAVHYFVSYYDYYQPEAYIPHTDTYIEKDAKINEEIDRLRHAATQALLTRDDVIIVSSVSCIYNLGSPEGYKKMALNIFEKQIITIQEFSKALERLQYMPDIELKRGKYRKSRHEIEVVSPTGEDIYKIKFKDLGKKQVISSIYLARDIDLDDLYTAQPQYKKVVEASIFPAKYWIAPNNKTEIALENIKAELQKHVKKLRKNGLALEAERLKRRTENDLRMIRSTGYCHGIENYSAHLEFRKPGKPPYTLIDYFKSKAEFLTIIDESHLTIPQIAGMHRGDHSRKSTLVKHGFRLPSALDNRPLRFGEFKKSIQKAIYISATPKDYELKQSSAKGIAEQLIRPTGLLDPTIEVHPTEGQIEHLISEITKRTKKKERVLVTTFTKKMAEDLADYLAKQGIKVNYIHSDIKTLQRVEILHDLRLGNYDVLVGVNLLREGLDLPEVSLVAILDADKEGFLRNATTLIQTMGRAARHINGHVIMYADKITKSMESAINETRRRRKAQEAYNNKNGIAPKSIQKEIKKSDLPGSGGAKTQGYGSLDTEKGKELAPAQRIELLQKDMERAVKDLRFEDAMAIREKMLALKKEL